MNFDYIKKLRILLSNSTDFQNWTGAANAAEALERIPYFRQDVPDFNRFAIINAPSAEIYHRETTGNGGGAFKNEFTAGVEFLERFADPNDTWDEAATTDFFDNMALMIAYFVNNSITTGVNGITIDTITEVHTEPNDYLVEWAAEQDGPGDLRRGFSNKWTMGRDR